MPNKPFWTGPGYRGEYQCPHSIGHGDHAHGCDGCCQRDDFPLNAANIEATRAKEGMRKYQGALHTLAGKEDPLKSDCKQPKTEKPSVKKPGPKRSPPQRKDFDGAESYLRELRNRGYL